MPKLLISLPSGDVSKEVTGDIVTIGRTPDNKIQIDHHSVSAHHARLLMLSNGNYKLKDLDSTNRSCVNNIPVNEAELSGSCFLKFGSIECVFKAEVATSGGQLQSQLEELQKQLESLMKARDQIHQQNQSLVKELENEKIAKDEALDTLSDVKKQLESLGKAGSSDEALNKANAQLSAAQLEVKELKSQLTTAQNQAKEITAKLEQTQKGGAELAEALKQVDALTQERNALLHSNQQLKESFEAVTAQLKEFQEGAAAEANIPVVAAPKLSVQQKAAESVRREMDESVEDFEEEQEMAEVSDQRAVVAGNAPGRIVTGAPLLSSWLNRGGNKRSADPSPSNITSIPMAAPAPVEEKNRVVAPPPPAIAPPPPPLRLVPAPSANGGGLNLGSPAVKIGRASANAAPQNPEIKPAWELLNAMRRSLHYFLRHQDEMKVLEEMTENAASLTKMATSELLRPIYELSSAVEALIRDLHSNPKNINASTLRTVGQSIDFLATLIDEANLSRIKDVTTAKIFAVDDDEGILETIKGTMEMAHLNITTVSQSPAALAALSEGEFDLILLDVGLPEMNGMDICSRVRAMPHHQKTPIVFLTGEATVQNRVQSTLNGGNDLIGKPFSILELAVKALTWIFKGQLGLV